MTDMPTLLGLRPDIPRERPDLPRPTLQRWQPMRLGLVELFHYDSEEFWFRDGHLLLRGNNGTGKSKVLSLTLPFLLDAHLRPSRIEPDGDATKRMSWNLLMSSYEKRTGYAWIEFGRLAESGGPRYLTLGAGLSAIASRPNPDSWYFIIEDDQSAPRINQDLWLMSEQRVVLTRERLRERLQGVGQVYENAKSYRRAVDERLFRLGPQRYDALIDTLIQLRQPQLSKKPDETLLSNALSEALPPLAPELLTDVADAMAQLEEDRRHLEDYQALARAVDRFERRYRVYTGTQSRRQARGLRSAQTEFDNASRLRNEAQVRQRAAEAEEGRANAAYAEAELVSKRAEVRLETLRSDPAMQDANRLQSSVKDMEARKRSLQTAIAATDEARRRSTRDREDALRGAELIAQSEVKLVNLRRNMIAHAEVVGIESRHAESPLAALATAELAALAQDALDAACRDLRALVVERRQDLALLRRRHADVAKADADLARRRDTRDEKRDEAAAAIARRDQADTEVEREGESLVEAWCGYLAGLEQLVAIPEDGEAALTALVDWVHELDGACPTLELLERQQQDATVRYARRDAALIEHRRTLEVEQAALWEERGRLEAGVDSAPPLPHTRDAGARFGREGAPLWQLVDFRETVRPEQRAGLEAALEASGLLDAWVSSDGRLQTRDGDLPWHDVQAVGRPHNEGSLAGWLQSAVPTGCAVPTGVIDEILSGIVCAAVDLGQSETWVAPDGRFRLGSLAGAWQKPEAVNIGYAARAAARARRLAWIAERLSQLADDLARVGAEDEQLRRDRQRAADERRKAPPDDRVRVAHAAAAASAREEQSARGRLADAERLYLDAEQGLRGAQLLLMMDTADLRLPLTLDGLPPMETALQHYHDIQAELGFAIHALRRAVGDQQRQCRRESESREDLTRCERERELAREELEEAISRLEVLRKTVGAKVEELQRQLAEAQAFAAASVAAAKRANEELAKSGEARAVAGAQLAAADQTLREKSAARTDAVARFQQFVSTGLLSAAWPDAALPEMTSSWTIDPALTLARRTEQALSAIKDDDEAWARVQKDVAADLTDLNSALSALRHQAQSETSDWGLIVNIIYQNRPERPDRLATRLAEEIAQRSELLTAKERAVLENHLQAEIAAEIQRLLQAAEAQRQAVNAELHRRPTSTGVRYRLQWQALAEEEGAPVGLVAARKHLLNTNADLWSAEDRRVVGDMLKQRILAERERADGETGAHSGSSLAEQLARALDYRRWHRFRIERLQDGVWRKLSGPASSGERALGLTVPLFAAVASFYSQGTYRLAPRLILIDEAFAGIDDAARAHCMALIREFDLDFVITSEREWACYAELPGVSICQLLRKEGIDAVFVSRWSWDGKAKRREADPDRRFAPA